jgi:CheY-like chemotaxis protein
MEPGRSSVLLVDCGSQPLVDLATRARRLGFRVLRAKTPEDAREALRDGRHAIGAVLVPPDLPAADLALAVRALRELSKDPRLPVLVAGPHPGDEACARLRAAGVELALFEPFDDHTLRFQLNCAVAGERESPVSRRAVRAPVEWPVRVRMGGREKQARAYCVSATGAFLATSRPSSRGSLVFLTLPLPEGAVDVAARVVHTNVPGNLVRENLPLGMAVQFTGASPETEASLRAFAERRAQALRV